MPDLRLLQEGRLRRSDFERRARRRRQIRVSLIGLVVLLIAGFVVTRDLGGTGPATSHAARHPIPAARSATSATKPAKHHLSGYARALAPAAVRRRVRRRLRGTVLLKQPLREGMLFDVASGRVLWERHASRELPIASLTKMMTALVTVSRTHLSDPVLITKQAVDFTGSGVGELPLGKRVPESALLYGLLLPSGNDAAIALAQHVAGTQSAFIGLMNQRAARMGLTCTHYTTVSGILDRGNHSCAVDLAVLAHAILTNPTLAPIVASPQAALKFPIKGGKLYLTNNNPLLLAGYAGTDGVKTGYTGKAGLCLVAAARRGRRWLGVVLLHSENWLTQAEALLNAGFAARA